MYLTFKTTCICDSIIPGFCPQVEGGGGALKVTEKKHTVPKGSVMAYKRKQLVFKKNSWGKQGLKEAGGSRTLLLLEREMRRKDHHQATVASPPVRRDKQHSSAVQGTHILTTTPSTCKQGLAEMLLWTGRETVSYVERV